MGEVTLRAHTDTWIDEAAPNQNYGAGVKLRVRGSGSGSTRHSLIFFPRPFPRGARVTSAILRLSARSAWGVGTRVITVQRITDPWKKNRVTWSNRPAADSTNQATLAVSNLGDEEEIELDVTDQFQDVSDGDPYHGLKVSIDTNEALAFYASDSPKDGVRPTLEFEWGGFPYPPSNLHPSSGRAISVASPRLGWRFTDNRGDTDQAYSRVQISASSSFAGALEYDSGQTANTRSSWALAGRYVVPAGAQRWFRVKVWDGSGLPSGWSDAVSFSRLSKGTLTITNPPPSPGNVVGETTPPLSWTFTGRTQERVRARVVELLPSGKTRELFEWPRQATDVTSITIPRGVIGPGKTFRAELWVWDTEDREEISGDHDYVFAQREFTYSRDGTPAAITSLTATLFEPLLGPAVTLAFTRATEPDYFALLVDGVQVFDRIDPDDVRTGVGTYSLNYWRLSPRVAHTLEVEAVVLSGGKHKHSSGNPSATVTTEPEGIWLIDETTNQAVKILGDDSAALVIGISGEVLRPLSRRRKVKIIDGIGGFEGPFSGEIETDGARDVFLYMIGAIYDELRVVAANLNIPIELDLDVSVTPTPTPGIGDRYDVGFSCYQVGEFFDVEGD